MSNCLERAGFITQSVATGDEALILIESAPAYKKPNVIVMEQNLDGLRGIEICSILRAKYVTKPLPVILIDTDSKVLDQLKGDAAAFDDYLIKPFAQNDLVSKVKSVLNKVRPTLVSKTLEYKDLKMDLASYKVSRHGREIHIGPTEFKILQCLIESPKKIFSRESLMQYVWGHTSNVEVRTIDVHINRLRTALKSSLDNAPFIKTVRSMGYCLSLPGID